MKAALWLGYLVSILSVFCSLPLVEQIKAFLVFLAVSLVIFLVSCWWLKSVPALISVPCMLLTLFTPRKAGEKVVFCDIYPITCLPLCEELLVSLAIIPVHCTFNLVSYVMKLHGSKRVSDFSSSISVSDKFTANFVGILPSDVQTLIWRMSLGSRSFCLVLLARYVCLQHLCLISL